MSPSKIGLPSMLHPRLPIFSVERKSSVRISAVQKIHLALLRCISHVCVAIGIILTLLLGAGASYGAKDNLERLPQEYFDLERVGLEVYEAYHAAIKAWRLRWRPLVQKGKNKAFRALHRIHHFIFRHNSIL